MKREKAPSSYIAGRLSYIGTRQASGQVIEAIVAHNIMEEQAFRVWVDHTINFWVGRNCLLAYVCT